MLYSKNGGPPQALPFQDAMPDGTIYTNLAHEPASRALLGWVEVPEGPPGLPDEIPMHRARKALRMLGPGGEVVDQNDVSWFELIQLAIAAIPDKVTRGGIQDDFDTAPNLVIAGANTQLIKAAIGMDQTQLEAVAWLALSLP